MEAFAALKLKKKREAEAKLAEEEERRKAEIIASQVPLEDARRLNELFGLPPPPEKVFALGKDAQAAVWWTFQQDMTNITGWEITRYRKDKTRPDENLWQFKGSTIYQGLLRLQVIVEELSNDYEYRFTIKAVNEKGKSVESDPSNEVVVESPLPSGWYRFFDRKKQKHYYASIKTGRSSWTRPELDPYFLQDEVYVNFQHKEIAYLKGLFIEDMEHFRQINLEQFKDILMEIGEKMSNRAILKLFAAYSSHENKDRLLTWQEFMEVITHIKRARKQPKIVKKPFRFIGICMNRVKVTAILGFDRDKLGLWVVEFNPFAGRNFYRHVVTGECMWEMPSEVKFFIPKRLENQLLKVFDYGQIEEFKQYFALLDIDNSGDLSDKEIRLLLTSMGIKIDDAKLEQLIEAIDVNKNGTIEFDEFCFMMLEICRGDKKGVFKGMKGSTAKLSVSTKNLLAQPPTDYHMGDDFSFKRLSHTVKRMRNAMIRSDSQESLGHEGGIEAVHKPRRNSAASSTGGNKKGLFGILGSSKGKASYEEPPAMTRQESRRRGSVSSVVSSTSTISTKNTKHQKKTMEFSSDEEDSDEEDEKPGGLVRSSSLSSFSSMFSGKKRGPNDHEPYCMCGCRRY